MIHVSVHLSESARQWVGYESMEYGLAPPATLDVLLDLITAKYPHLAEHQPELEIRLNGRPATSNMVLTEGDAVEIRLKSEAVG